MTSWTLGMDYPRYSIWNQMELMFSIKSGSFPLYVPGFAGGHSASALSLGQLYHPISYFASMMPGYWKGYALEWNTLIRLLTLAITHLMLFSFIKRFGIQTAVAMILSMVTVYNLRMLDLFRYGASLESWTGFLALSCAIGYYYLQPQRKLWLVVIVTSTYWLICSGHPQMSYYGLLGVGIFTLLIPSVLPQLAATKYLTKITRTRFYILVFSCILVGGVLSAAYIFPFYFDFLKLNTARFAQEYGWADGYRDTLLGTINNFFFPLRSDVHGAFGGSLLYLAAVLLPILVFFKIKIPKIMLLVYAILAFVFLYMQGVRTPVHFIAWKYFPFASSFRIAGRISMIIPLLMLLLLLWVVKVSDKLRVNTLKYRIVLNPCAILAGAALVAIGLYTILPQILKSDMTVYSAVNIHGIPLYTEYILLLTSMIALLFFAIHGYLDRFKFLTGFLFFIFSCFTLMGYISQGTWIEEKRKTPTFQQIRDEKKDHLAYRMPPGSGLVNKVVQRQIENSCLEPYLGKIYCKLTCVEDNDSTYRHLAKGRTPDEIIIETNLSIRPSSTTNDMSFYPNEVRLVYASFNKLVFDIKSNCSGFFGFAYPFTGHWQAKVDGLRVAVFRANGAANAVRIPSGLHQVEFLYWSNAAFWGMLISILTFVVVGCAFTTYLMDKWMAAISSILIIAIGFGLGWAWYDGLYQGDNLNNRYHWSSNSLPSKPSIAYGKRSYFLSQGAGKWSLFSYGGLAVDGNYSPNSGFKSLYKRDPYWLVDLYDTHRIGSIVLYESSHGDQWNRRPLKVLISSDGKAWHPAAAVEETLSGQPIKIEFSTDKLARYLMVKATGSSRLSFDEIEIFASD